MESYQKPELEMLAFNLRDVISTSGDCTSYVPHQCEPMCPIEGPGECMLGDED